MLYSSIDLLKTILPVNNDDKPTMKDGVMKYLLAVIRKSKLLTSSISQILRGLRYPWSLYLKSVKESTPQYTISHAHINNCNVLLDREELLTKLPQGGHVAELGVDEGQFSQKILDLNKAKKLVLVDIWDTQRYNKKKAKLVRTKFADQIKSGVVEVVEGLSTTAVEQFEDYEFDWIYIDTDHTYLTTINELNLWSKKIKSGGFICGHDFDEGEVILGRLYGVIEAVNEFCVSNDWEIVFITMNAEEGRSFAIRKMK